MALIATMSLKLLCTNRCGLKGECAGWHCRIKHVVAYLREKLPRSYIVMLGVLPRSGWTLPDKNAWPNRLTPAIEAINNASKVMGPARPRTCL